MPGTVSPSSSRAFTAALLSLLSKRSKASFFLMYLWIDDQSDARGMRSVLMVEVAILPVEEVCPEDSMALMILCFRSASVAFSSFSSSSISCCRSILASRAVLSASMSAPNVCFAAMLSLRSLELRHLPRERWGGEGLTSSTLPGPRPGRRDRPPDAARVRYDRARSPAYAALAAFLPFPLPAFLAPAFGAPPFLAYLARALWRTMPICMKRSYASSFVLPLAFAHSSTNPTSSDATWIVLRAIWISFRSPSKEGDDFLTG